MPIERGPSPAARAAPEPPLDPPGVRPRFHGFAVRPKIGASFMGLWPNSGEVTLPTMIAPAAFMRATAATSAAGTFFSKIHEQ